MWQASNPRQWIEQLTRRRIALYGIAFIGALAALGIVTLIVLSYIDLAPPVARYASRTLGRPITIGALRVHWGTAVAVELQDLAIDDAPGGSQSRMLQITRLDARIAPWSLLAWAVGKHPPTIRHVSIDGVKLLVEHTAGDRPNWRFGKHPVAHRNPRAGFPSLLDARLHDVEVDVRTSSGKTIRIHLDTASIATPDVNQPVTLTATGAYNDTPVQLSAALHSFNDLHDATQPFATDIHLRSADTLLEFAGTMTDPLNADGCAGQLNLTAPTLDQLLAVAGVGGQAALPLVLAGALTRQGDLWRLSDAQGTLAAHPFQLSFNMREGARRAPDDMTVDANFSVLDLSKLGDNEKSADTSLHIDDQPGNLLDAHVRAQQFVVGTVRASDVDLGLKMTPGALAVEHLAFNLIGGAAQVTAAVTNTQSSSAIQFDAALAGANTGQLSSLLGIGSIPLTGAVDAKASLRFAGNTLSEAERTTSGTVALSMQGGSIQHKVIALASTDLRLLFGKSDGVVRIACLLGVLDLHDGIGRLAPLRIRTADGTVAAAGTIDTRRDAIDLTVASESASTSFFALDVPLRIAGPIRGPHVSPVLKGGGAATNASADLRTMPPALQEFVRRNPCLAGGR